jgi:hypothetical protein
MDTASLASGKRFSLSRSSKYQSMMEDNSVDSDGSNMTSVTTTTTASSASSPASIRQQISTPSHRQLLLQRRRMQQQKLVSNAMMRIQHQSRSDQSSSDDGLTQSTEMPCIATALHMAHNKTIAPAGLIAEAIEMKSLPHKSVQQEDSTKTTISTLDSERSGDEMRTDHKRSSSFHGKGGSKILGV